MRKLAKSLFSAPLIAISLIPLVALADMTMTIAPDFAMAAMMRQVRDTNGTSASTNRTSQTSNNIARSLSASQLTYRFSAARTRINLAKFVEKSRATDPVGSAKMAALFSSTDIMGMIDQKMQQTYGMRANNVADAHAVWWVSAWMGSKGRSDDATPGQMAMVKRQAANALASLPQFASASDVGKQELSEAMLVQAAMIGDMIDTYKSDPAMLAKTRAAIAKGAREMGIDLNSMKLTDEGFVPSGKTSSADPRRNAAPGAAEQALATNNVAMPSVAANDNLPSYLLLATAGGAGIGGVFLISKIMRKRG
jgi:hypothetical protein